MTTRTRAVLRMLGGAVVVAGGLGQIALVSALNDSGTVEVATVLSSGWAVLTGVVLVVAGWSWWSTGRTQRGLTAAALTMAIVGITTSIVGGFLLGLDPDVDASDATFLMFMLPLQHAVSVLIAAMIRRESALAARRDPDGMRRR